MDYTQLMKALYTVQNAREITLKGRRDSILSCSVPQGTIPHGWQIVAEQSTNLQSWYRGYPYLETIETTILDARRQQVKVRTNPAFGQPAAVFLRLVLEPTP